MPIAIIPKSYYTDTYNTLVYKLQCSWISRLVLQLLLKGIDSINHIFLKKEKITPQAALVYIFIMTQ